MTRWTCWWRRPRPHQSCHFRRYFHQNCITFFKNILQVHHQSMKPPRVPYVSTSPQVEIIYQTSAKYLCGKYHLTYDDHLLRPQSLPQTQNYACTRMRTEGRPSRQKYMTCDLTCALNRPHQEDIALMTQPNIYRNAPSQGSKL